MTSLIVEPHSKGKICHIIKRNIQDKKGQQLKWSVPGSEIKGSEAPAWNKVKTVLKCKLCKNMTKLSDEKCRLDIKYKTYKRMKYKIQCYIFLLFVTGHISLDLTHNTTKVNYNPSWCSQMNLPWEWVWIMKNKTRIDRPTRTVSVHAPEF